MAQPGHARLLGKCVGDKAWSCYMAGGAHAVLLFWARYGACKGEIEGWLRVICGFRVWMMEACPRW